MDEEVCLPRKPAKVRRRSHAQKQHQERAMPCEGPTRKGLKRHFLRIPLMTQERPPRQSMKGTCSPTCRIEHIAHGASPDAGAPRTPCAGRRKERKAYQ